ncbi:MAG TPA: hypothetical protein PKW33_13715 [Anaerolineaceae bacterium]|nr:hypothetical protein [Anaerolineaceae bacterium]HPN52644.1 hypothetical protein [Anaerolineaceae bacterium]
MTEAGQHAKMVILFGEGSGARLRAQELVNHYRAAGMACLAFCGLELEELQARLKDAAPDMVFSAIHHCLDSAGKAHNVHAVLSQMDLPYVGSTPEVLDLVLSKQALKRRWLEDGVRTPAFAIIRQAEEIEPCLADLQSQAAFPLILKPDGEGNSRGISEDSVVFTGEQFCLKCAALLKMYGPVLAEHYLGQVPGLREFTVAMVGNQRRLVMPAEICLNIEKKIRLVTTADKDGHHTCAVPVNDPILRCELIAFASQAFLSAGVQDYARCDILAAEGRYYAIEINGQPMLPDKWFDACAAGAGLTQAAYLQAILNSALNRNHKNKEE